MVEEDQEEEAMRGDSGEAVLIRRSVAVVEKALASDDRALQQRASEMVFAFLLRDRGEAWHGSR